MDKVYKLKYFFIALIIMVISGIAAYCFLPTDMGGAIVEDFGKSIGDLIKCEAEVAYAGRTSFIVHILFTVAGEKRVEGFISYVNVNEKGKAVPHNIELDLKDEELKELNERAKKFL